MGSTPDPLKFCSERGHLLDDLNRATSDYSQAVNTLNLDMGSMPETAYRIAEASVEQARRNAEQCRKALVAHQKEHGC
jgi:hypothetical protein